MNKRSLILFSLLMIGGGLAWLLLRWYSESEAHLPAATENDLAKAAARLDLNSPTQPAVVPAAPLAASHSVRLAIGWLGLPDETSNGQVTDLLTVELTGAKGLELVDRQSLGTVLRELELSLSGLVRAKDAVRVGKLLRAEWFLLGTSVAGANTNRIIVARIVDARTGILHDVGVFTPSKGVSGLAAEIAGFVRQCRQGASVPKPRTFLAIGTFADAGINTRQAEFPQQLRAYLTRAYQPLQMTLLERDQVSTLLQEVRLDLAGLTDDSSANAPQPMQSAFWLVNGFYQSFETSSYEVELVLQVTRVFGRTTNFTFRGHPGEGLFREVKAAIDTTVAQAGPSILAPTRRSEARQQMNIGKELFNTGPGASGKVSFTSPGYRMGGLGEQDYIKRNGYLTEAVRAFETALLLEPDNRQAKFYLSACYLDWSLGRYDEGISVLRELAASTIEDQWSQEARVALGDVYFYTNPREAARWLNEAASRTKDLPAADAYRSLAQQVVANAFGADTNTQDMAILERRLFEQGESAQRVLQGKPGAIEYSYGLGDFAHAFGANREAAALRIVEVMPKLIQKFPDLAPHLLSSALCFQVDTNAPIIAEFRKSLSACATRPEKILGCANYFENLLRHTYSWCFNAKLYVLAAEVVEAKRDAALRRPEIGFNEHDKIQLAFAYLKLERWRDALLVLEDLGEVSVVMGWEGPWGEASDPFWPARQAVLCRAKLGMAQPASTGLAALREPCLCLHTSSAFATSPAGLWIVIGAKLLQLGFDLQTNKVVSLPIAHNAEITALCLGSEKIWIGTGGEGLVECDMASGKCRLMTEKDGLLINHITSLCLQDKTLWIGFGRERAGGLGALDLRNGHFSALTPALPADPLDARKSDPPDGPPRHAVSSLEGTAPGQLWMLVAGRGLCRYRLAQNSWDTATFGNGVWLQCFALNGDSLIAGFSLVQGRLLIENERPPGDTNQLGTTERVVTLEESARLQADSAMHRRIRGFTVGESPYKGELRLLRLRDETWQKLGGDSVLPAPPGLLLIDGNDLWLAGSTYIAVFDLAQNKIRAVCSIPSSSVNRIQIGGGFLWAQFDKHLHKAPLSATR